MNYRKLLFIIVFIMIIIPIPVYANIICNDGTVSKSCTDCHQGCCSRHGGCSKSRKSKSISDSESDSDNYYKNNFYNKTTAEITTQSVAVYDTKKSKLDITDEDTKDTILIASGAAFITSLVSFLLIKPSGKGGIY